MSIDIKQLVKEATTNPDLNKRVQGLQTQNLITKQEVYEVWVEWGRKQLGFRLQHMTCLVVGNALYGKITLYDVISTTVNANHNWMLNLLFHFSRLCFENNWSFYGVLIRKKDGTNPTGYLPWYLQTGDSVRFPGVANSQILINLTDECFEKQPPSAHEISTALADYIYRNKM